MLKSLMLVGVGGQGTILTSKILSEGLVRCCYDVKMSEIHGMSQRGGSVNTQIRFGDKVYSPVISTADADLLVAFEKIEALRYLCYLKKGGTVLVNDYEIYPPSVLTGIDRYPEGVIEKLKSSVENSVLIDAARIAERLGNVRTQNMVILGAIVKTLGVQKLDWSHIIKEFLPKRLHEINIMAFNAGLESI
ncbi:MAG: indolepyruvate oxidoreductase subunit beta [Thermoanaerobacterales bacterium]|jgi:indolepyruvate ferredoxin oxidoreductase beta subunit|nr:indolepyruvate oxidoreductase subunit beta [Thermoanaerobacterales bacterium]